VPLTPQDFKINAAPSEPASNQSQAAAPTMTHLSLKTSKAKATAAEPPR
jgi:hypothetical protein